MLPRIQPGATGMLTQVAASLARIGLLNPALRPSRFGPAAPACGHPQSAARASATHPHRVGAAPEGTPPVPPSDAAAGPRSACFHDGAVEIGERCVDRRVQLGRKVGTPAAPPSLCWFYSLVR